MNNFKIYHTRPASLLIIDNIAQSCIAVGPSAAELVAPELMDPAQLASRRFQHSPRECASIQVLPQARTRQLVDADCIRA